MKNDWLLKWLKYMDRTEPPVQFKLWSGISAIAGCLGRKCYTEWEKYIFPNKYIILCGPSGSRKGTALVPCYQFLQEVGVHLSAESTTRESIINEMQEICDSRVPQPDDPRHLPSNHASITIYSPELVVFLGHNDARLYDALTDWWDCPAPWRYKTKNSGEYAVPAVFVNLLGGTTPELMSRVFPEDTIGGGLLSRSIIVYARKRSKLVADPRRTPEEKELELELIRDLEVIAQMSGEFIPNQEYIDYYMQWYEESEANPPHLDYKLDSYLTRRATHARKLSMIVSASRSFELDLVKEDLERAIAILEETEKSMALAFSGSGRLDVGVYYRHLCSVLVTEKEITMGELTARFSRDLTPDELSMMVEVLVNKGFVTKGYETVKGRTIEKLVYAGTNNMEYEL